MCVWCREDVSGIGEALPAGQPRTVRRDERDPETFELRETLQLHTTTTTLLITTRLTRGKQCFRVIPHNVSCHVAYTTAVDLIQRHTPSLLYTFCLVVTKLHQSGCLNMVSEANVSLAIVVQVSDGTRDDALKLPGKTLWNCHWMPVSESRLIWLQSWN